MQPPSVLTGSEPSISVAPVGDQLLLLAVRAQPGLGQVHDLGAGLGVLELGDVDVVGPDTGLLEGRRAASTVGGRPVRDRVDGLKTSKDPKRRVRNGHRRAGRRARGAARGPDRPGASTSATAPSPGEQNMYCVSGSVTIVEARISSSVSGCRRQAFGLRAPLREGLVGDPGERAVVIPCSAM